ncbi:Cytoskeleton Polymerization-inhibiting Toxin. Toxin of CptAB toxin-antitoxin pair (McNeil, 2012). The C-terminal CptA domain binds to and inhibits the polymerization of MreB and FtsZ in vitro [Dickeya aquatica]|uniref:Cytoskeleton Polymerization-inhibiting Toxin. Toxin of CptAB toxin-antitoxin pair (McNeil, 2012). The C-terminal CptA domain binds to and inhibits the polymerization of MreB and FtsZ in vitro n=2 Tax=Pectobacteriaceae TaxID=1903410 RepID=A0A375A7C8_9GAMM|nr:Cytoskeleton Polymerization-inhibiting Toxin. Toxin of CptAB toxin-antitoxin pair (McNeil, 2012). The C-terminal CptA domain binds to and inhibits the polymerization of MreB and FtsZ in vitro [Dickeya aquatica]
MQLFSLMMHGLLVLMILLAPWPDGYAPLWLGLVTLVVFGFVRSQRVIKSRQGEISLHDENRLHWQQRDWLIVRRPWMLRSGILLSLRAANGKGRQHLWLASDSMGNAEWRRLRQLLQHPALSGAESSRHP